MAHGIAINNMRAPFVRTGYESVLGVRVGGKFVVTAEDDGVVVSVTKSNVTVNYKTLGKKTYKIKDWTSKEESGVCYRHTMSPNVKEGDKIIKDDTLIYDTLFFEPDIFNNKRVIYKQGMTVRVAFVEDQQTYEDSGAISKSLTKLMGTKMTKVITHRVNCDDNLHNFIEIGTKVDPNTILYTTATSLIGDKPSKEVAAILESISKSTPKAKYKGTVSKIVVYYNCEEKSLSKTLKAIVENSNSKLIADTGFTGRVNESYSSNGKKLLENEVEIKIYIETDQDMGIGDKAVLGNQMKFTIGEVFDSTMTTEDGTEIDALFSYRSIGNRIVYSALINGTTSSILQKVQENVVDMYFK